MSVKHKTIELAIERLNHMWLFLHNHGLTEAYTRWEKYQGFEPYNIEKFKGDK